MQYPNMRAELLEYLQDLADIDYQQQAWVRDEAAPGAEHDTLDHAIHFLFDDTSLAVAPEAAIGVFLVDQEEARAVHTVTQAIDALLHRYGTSLSDAAYLAKPEWGQVVQAATLALQTFRRSGLAWIPCDSPADLHARLAGRTVIGQVHTADANTWGYLEVADGRRVEIAYANTGLMPQAVLDGDDLLVGIGECLACFALSTATRRFLYRMPVLFHEFVQVGDPLIVRDELGFVGLARDGAEQWSFATEDLIASYTLAGRQIRGMTASGQAFAFDPATQYSPERPVSATPMRSSVYDIASTQRRHQPRRR